LRRRWTPRSDVRRGDTQGGGVRAQEPHRAGGVLDLRRPGCQRGKLIVNAGNDDALRHQTGEYLREQCPVVIGQSRAEPGELPVAEDQPAAMHVDNHGGGPGMLPHG